jgi:hypothetical protein
VVRKGFFFAVDAAFSVVIIVAVLLFVVLVTSGLRGTEVTASYLQVLAGDELASLDESGVLNETFSLDDVQAAAVLKSFLSSTLPANAAGLVNVSFYEFVGSGSCRPACSLSGPSNGFCLCRNFVASNEEGRQSFAFSGVARRMFFSFRDGVPVYGLADAVVWLR